MKILLKFLFFSACLNAGKTGFAQILSGSNEPIALASQPIITPGYFLQVFFSLILIIALIMLGGKYLLPKLAIKHSKNLQIIDRIGLEANVSLYIVKSKKQAWVVGVSNKNIRVIDKLEIEDLEPA